MKDRYKILCVDDEPGVLRGLTLRLRRGFDVSTAPSGEEGLAILRDKPGFAVVVSDMQMPGMDGATFLGKAREVQPDAVRMLLTGVADLATAIAAVNQGGIFRFLCKPCKPPELMKALVDATELYRLRTAERELTEKTLYGAVRMMAETLALVAPLEFGRGAVVLDFVRALSQHAGARAGWEAEIAAMMVHAGTPSLPEEVRTRWAAGRPLTASDRERVGQSRKRTAAMLRRVPRLEHVADLVTGEAPGVESGRLALAIRLADLVAAGATTSVAVAEVVARPPVPLSRALRAGLDGLEEARTREVLVGGLKVGDVLAVDVLTPSGQLLVGGGQTVTEVVRERLIRFSARGGVREPVLLVDDTINPHSAHAVDALLAALRVGETSESEA
jgi:CheY-like chemotaxis protein